MDRFWVFVWSWEYDVPFSWAIERRLVYLNQCVVEIGDRIERLMLKKMVCGEGAEVSILNALINGCLKEQKKLNWEMQALISKKQNNGITPDTIERAKSYDFRDLLVVPEKGNIKCPFHEDKHPSASLKNNKLHCFSCNKTWNPIDYVMEKEGLNFKEAVLRLQ